jgi:CxxC motif-containing protein
MEKRELTCIGCPLGCPITVTIEQKEVTAVTGNTCPRGDAYARKEVTNPTRIVTSTVRVVGGTAAMVSCKTKEDVPKSKIFDVIEALRDVSVPAPVGIGDVLVRDVAGTKTDIVATKNVAVSSPE